METTDAIILILFTLFIASTVNERIIDFIKVQFPGLWMKSFNFSDEIKRRKRIWTLSFILGLVSALLIDVNLIELFSENKEAFGKIEGVFDHLKTMEDRNGEKGIKGFYLAFGYLLTAVFISLGSKFWHDLLDIALVVKRSREKIQQFDPKNVTEIEQVEKYLQENELQLAQKALEAHRNRLIKAYGDDATFAVGYEYIDDQFRICIQVLDRTKEEESNEPDLEKSGNRLKRFGQDISREIRHYSGQIKRITYNTDYGYVFKFPVVVYYPGVAIAAVEEAARAGGGLYNKDNKNNMGTFGCIVKDLKEGCDDLYLLTCYHCVRIDGEHPWESFNKQSKKNEIYYKLYPKALEGHPIGKIEIAYRSNTMDLALVKPNDDVRIDDYRWNPTTTVPINHTAVTDEDGRKRRRIWFSGLTSGTSEGYIINYKQEIDIKYIDGKHRLSNLIVFSKTKTKPYRKPCDKGDSGAIIIDAETKQALGMVVAVDKNFGYAIPIKNILEEHGLALYLDPCMIPTEITT